ncbi:arsenate reductase/protein-tyrosine-phosphatase family protein [Segnochrobactrum spirostomi]|uniref:protein-tyrosine-phosphatase n=1 Tax=Segnochrobactrum spirostomi TaxID=2608987 RepID=A0A6A7XXP5_9HYPH|nr:protein tyrosine phosphatase [Segnochrobactrum spirostomi]MQT11450.1 protein tyrosine phosphatase [Segnochrobactrum spirostomi]
MSKSAVLGLVLTVCASTVAFAAGPVKIAFVDTGNTGRSVTAEAIADKYIAAKHLDVVVISRAVDLNPFNVTPEPNAAVLLAKDGMDVSHHTAQQVTINDVRHADLILTMTAGHRDRLVAMFPEAKGKVFVLGDYATGKPEEIEDAYGKPMAVYETMYTQVGTFTPKAIDKAVATLQSK